MGVREIPGVGDRGSRSWSAPASGSAGLGCGLPAGELTTCGEGSRGGGGPEPRRAKRRRESAYLDRGAQDAGGRRAGVADVRQVLVAGRGRGGGGAAGDPHGGDGRTAPLPRRTRRSNSPACRAAPPPIGRCAGAELTAPRPPPRPTSASAPQSLLVTSRLAPLSIFGDRPAPSPLSTPLLVGKPGTASRHGRRAVAIGRAGGSAGRVRLPASLPIG